MVAPPRGPENPHGNAFRAEATLLATEKRRRGGASTRRRRGSGGSSTRPRRTAWASRSATGSCPARTPRRSCQPDAAVLQAGRASRRTTSGSRRTTRASGTPPATTPTSTPAATACRVWTAADRPIVDTDLVALVRLRPHPRPAARGLAGDAGRRARLHAQARRLLRAQPGAGRAGPGRLTPVSRPYRARRRGRIPDRLAEVGPILEAKRRRSGAEDVGAESRLGLDWHAGTLESRLKIWAAREAVMHADPPTREIEQPLILRSTSVRHDVGRSRR